MQRLSRAAALKQNLISMKYTSKNAFTANITRVSYLPSKNNSVWHILDRIADADIETSPETPIVIITPNSKNLDFCIKLCGIGAGVTNIGSGKDDFQRMHSFAKFRHIRHKNNRKPLYDASTKTSIHADIPELFGEAFSFKSEEAMESFLPVADKIKAGLSKCDQSLQHMMAKYTVECNKATSKGNCGITRNCRNIYTIDCDERISHDVLISIINGTYVADSHNVTEESQVSKGIEELVKLVKQIHSLTGALPHIVYNKKTSHFQIQYLMKDPIYVTIESAAASFKSYNASKKDVSFFSSYTLQWKSVFTRGFSILENDGDACSLYDAVYDRFWKYRDEYVIVVVQSYDQHIEYVDLVDKDTFKEQLMNNTHLKKVKDVEFVPTQNLGIKMFDIAKNNKLLLNTPEYIYYGNAHKNIGYVNTGGHKFADINYNYCANKSLSIGTHLSHVFDVEEEDSSLTREQIICLPDGRYSTDMFNMMDISAWEYADKYAIDAKFIAFMGSLDSAERLFNSDALAEYEKFVACHTFMMDKNVPLRECKEAYEFKNMHNIDISEHAEATDDESYESFVKTKEENTKQLIEHLNNQYDKGVPDTIDALSEKYLGVPYLELISNLVNKIETHEHTSRHKFDHISGLYILYKAISHNIEFAEICRAYNQTAVITEEGSNAFNEVNTLIEYSFNDVVNNIYERTLPGTCHTGEYEHKFDLRTNIIRMDPSALSKKAARMTRSSRWVINGSHAKSLLSGSTKLDVIYNMFKLLPTYIHSEELAREHAGMSKSTSYRTLVKSAWMKELDECFDPNTASNLRSVSVLYKPTSYKNSNCPGKGIKYITLRELKEHGSSYYINKNKHIADFCLETATHFRTKGDPHANIDRYISSLEYFIELVRGLQCEGDWCAEISDENVDPSLDEDIQNSGIDTQIEGKYVVKDRELILAQVKTYRYFMKIYTHINATLDAVDEYSEEPHIIKLQSVTHELHRILDEFLRDMYHELTSYTNTDCVTSCKDISCVPHIDVEEAISVMMYHIELYYNMVDFFGDDYLWDMDWGDDNDKKLPITS